MLCDSCQISNETVAIVKNCPDSAEQWKEAAARKNCAAEASQCDEPERLKYHCVINTFVNLTLEVCAYWKTIHLGMTFFSLLNILIFFFYKCFITQEHIKTF